MAVAVDKRGLKRICTSCGTRFYDMNKRPINCPNCATEFTSEVKLKTRRGRAAVNDDAAEEIEVKKPVEADVEEEADGTLVSLDEVQELEEADDEDEDAVEADLDIDDDLDVIDDDLEEEVLEDVAEDDDAPKKGKK